MHLASFSPLLIGEDSATRTGRSRSARRSTLSVPSSSGKILRRAHPAGRRSRPHHFQSPPHRGRFCDARLGQEMRSATSFQSPPHRGRFCDGEHGDGPLDADRLSVPSSSGKILRLAEDGVRPLITATPFSPLLIGEDSATTGRSVGRAPGPALSVPSSSGKILRRKPTSADARRASLSVPSSSGKILRRDARASHRSLFVFQSPPHRGRFCDTGARSEGELEYISFQSPPHRGRFCDITPVMAAPPRSPLSVPSSSGKILRLAEAAERTSTSSHFQSPPHRGRFCDPGPDARRPHGVLFQSPPHRGRFCDPGGGLRVGRRGQLSVPSSSGKILRLYDA